MGAEDEYPTTSGIHDTHAPAKKYHVTADDLMHAMLKNVTPEHMGSSSDTVIKFLKTKPKKIGDPIYFNMDMSKVEEQVLTYVKKTPAPKTKEEKEAEYAAFEKSFKRRMDSDPSVRVFIPMSPELTAHYTYDPKTGELWRYANQYDLIGENSHAWKLKRLIRAVWEGLWLESKCKP